MPASSPVRSRSDSVRADGGREFVAAAVVVRLALAPRDGFGLPFGPRRARTPANGVAVMGVIQHQRRAIGAVRILHDAAIVGVVRALGAIVERDAVGATRA